MNVTIEQLPPGDWSAFARDHGNFFHTTEWIDVLIQCFGYTMHYLCAWDAGRLDAILPLAEVPPLFGPRRLVALPFSFSAGPVGARDGLGAVAAAASDLAADRGAAFVELKHSQALSIPPGDFTRVMRYAEYVVPTEAGLDRVERTLDKNSTIRGIRKAERERTRAEVTADETDWRAMARLHLAQSRGHGVPPIPSRFFATYCPRLQEAGCADLLVARTPERRVAAGMVVWKGPRQWVYAYGASEPSLLHRRPNHALLWAMVQGAVAAGKSLSLGRAAPEQSGLVQFKERWGARPNPLAYDYWPEPRGLNVADRKRSWVGWGARVWSRLPVMITRLGAPLYRYLG